MLKLKEKLHTIELTQLLPKSLREGADLYGIDMGSKSIKIVRLSRTSFSAPWTLESWAHLPFPDTVEGITLIEKAPEAVQLLKDFLGKEKKKAKVAAISVSGNSVVVRFVKLPKTTREQLAKTLPQEAEPYIPFSIPEVDLSFEILGESTEGDQIKTEAVLVAAKKELLMQQLDIIKMAGLEPGIVDIDAFCLQRVVPVANATDIILILNIGATLTTISLQDQGNCRFVRDIFIAGNTINKALEKTLGLSPEEAEKTKQGVSLSLSGSAESAQVISGALKDLVVEIHRSLDFYLSQQPERQVRKVFLAGGSARLQGLDSFLSGELRLPVEILDPFSNIQGGDKVPPEIKPHLAVAAGLAMRREGD